MNLHSLRRIPIWLYNAIISVPVRIKITGIILMTVITLGLSLSYWVTTSLSDWLSYLLTDVRVEAAMRAGSRSVILITILAAAFSLVIASFLTFLLTRPLTDLRDMALEVADGNLEARAPIWAKDEIGEVAIAINTMTDHLVATQADLARTNRRLSATNQIMLAAERESDIHDVLYAILQSIAQVTGLQTGWIYLLDPERDRFHLASWHDAPETMQPLLLHEYGDDRCQCQQDLVNGRLPTLSHCHPCERLTGSPYAAHKHISLPIEARGRRYGVVNLLCPEKYALGQDDRELLATVGSQISEIVANAWLRLKLAEKEAARQALLESLVKAQEDERGRLARELHDGAGQMLTSLLVRIKTMEKQCPTPELKSDLHTLLDLVSETVEQMRDLSYRLRPAALEELGLPVALRTLVREMTADTAVSAHYQTNLQKVPLPHGLDVTLYRIAQEGLTNVLRHAQAEQVTVKLLQEDNNVVMRICDDGCGFIPHAVTAVPEPDRRHLGLISMQERAAMAGGTLRIDSTPGEGTTLHVRVPLQEKAPS